MASDVIGRAASLRERGDAGGTASMTFGPGCGEEDNGKLPVYTAAEFDYIRVECCDTCKSYIKTVDLTKNGRAEPVVDEIASAPLDLWAQEHGYSKLQLNVVGL